MVGQAVRIGALVALAFLSTAGAASAERRVRGTGGQSDLVLDYGRSLSRVPLTRAGAPSGLPPLSPVEKARLDARRVLRASSLSSRGKLERVVEIVRQRLPYASPSAYADLEAAAIRDGGALTLSKAVASRVGICREQAWLLAGLVREGGLPARVRYGEVFTPGGRHLGSHAWVEVKQGAQTIRLDPSARQAVTMNANKRQLDLDLVGVRRRIVGSRSRQVIYAPTNDLVVVDR